MEYPSGRRTSRRLNQGGDRQANAALRYRGACERGVRRQAPADAAGGRFRAGVLQLRRWHRPPGSPPAST
ncbi:hypothetical protein ACWDE9_26750 [Streptomyces olivaceoviridis]